MIRVLAMVIPIAIMCLIVLLFMAEMLMEAGI